MAEVRAGNCHLWETDESQQERGLAMFGREALLRKGLRFFGPHDLTERLNRIGFLCSCGVLPHSAFDAEGYKKRTATH